MTHLSRLIFAAVLVAGFACGQTCTRITDTLYGPTNAVIPSVTLQISLQAPVDNSGRTTLPAPVTVTVTNGRLNICLVPGTYSVSYSTPTTLSGTWAVAPGGPFTVSDVEVGLSAMDAPLSYPALPATDGVWCMQRASGAYSWVPCPTNGGGGTQISWASITNTEWTSLTNAQWLGMTN